MFEAVARLRSDVALLGSVAGGKARSLVRSIIAVARGVYIGVVASALLIGIGGNALLSQIGRHPAPLGACPSSGGIFGTNLIPFEA